MDMRALVGGNVLRLRRRKSLTQERFAELAGISQQYVSGLERGTRNPTVIMLYQMAEALGVQPLDLLRPPRSRQRVGGRKT